MRHFRPGLIVVLAAGALAAVPARAAEDKTVLTVYAEARSLPVISALDQAIRSTLQLRSPAPIRFHTEYLDLSWFAGPRAEKLMARVIKEKYEGRRIDVAIVCGEPAIRFLLRERAAVIPGVPIVFCTADRAAILGLALPQDVTGVTMSIDWSGTVDLALRLHPGTHRVVFIGGTGPSAREWERLARRALAKYADRLELVYLTDLPLPEVVKSVSTMPADTVALFNTFIRDADGRTFTTPEALTQVAAAAGIPIYSIGENLIGYGIVGGPMVDFRAQGVKAAELAWRVLDGERPGPADIVAAPPNTYVFDARQLKRWRIPEKELPPGSVVRFRQPSMWELYKWQILGAIAVTGLQTLLIAGLLLERRQRKRAETSLDERLRFETLLSDLAAAFIKIPVEDVDRQIVDGLRRVVEQLGVDRAALAEFGGGGREIRVTHSWTRPDVPATPPLLETRGLPWSIDRILSGKVVALSHPGDLPDEAERDRETIRGLGVRSLVLVPFVMEESVGGVLACSVLRDERSWPDELVKRLHLLAEVFAIVLLRRRAQTALEESEGRFRLMADAAPVMIWMAGTDGLCIDFNRAWLQFTGRTLQQELGDGWAEGVHPDDRERCMSVYREALAARRPFTIEYRLRRADGIYRSVLDNGTPRFDGDFKGYIGSAIDITQTKEAQQALLESIALRSAILGSLYGEVVALDREGAILAVNEAWNRFGQQNGADPASMAVGTNYLDVCRRAARSGDAEAVKALEAIESVLAGRSERALLEYACHSPAGTCWFAMTVEPFKRPEGGVVISHIDITRRWRAEEEAERGREDLAHALRVSTLGELAATLAHEINQPLTAIVSNAQAARRMLETTRLDREEFGDALDDIAEDARRTADIIRRLRALFRKEHSQRRPVDVNEVVLEVTGLLRKDLERKRVTLRLSLAKGLPRVAGDPVQLQQVLVNLVVNACDAMKSADGGPRELRIETASDPSGKVEIGVRDTGVGVPEAELGHMFERFVTTKPDGLGMGLAISRSIVEAHGGRIWATRNEDRGLTLHCELPSADAVPEARTVHPAPGGIDPLPPVPEAAGR